MTHQKKHIHKWDLVEIRSEYPIGLSGTAAPELYGYLLCQCPKIKKIKIDDKARELTSSMNTLRKTV